MTPRPRIDIKIFDPRLEDKLPQYATEGSAGLDLCAAIDQDMTIYADESILVPTGIAIHLSDPQLAALVLPRSGLGHKYGIVLGNLVGLIDSDYQGQIFVSLWNRSHRSFLLSPLDRIAQLVVIPIMQVALNVVTEFSCSVRGTKGFGSTGQH